MALPDWFLGHSLPCCHDCPTVRSKNTKSFASKLKKPKLMCYTEEYCCEVKTSADLGEDVQHARLTRHSQKDTAQWADPRGPEANENRRFYWKQGSVTLKLNFWSHDQSSFKNGDKNDAPNSHRHKLRRIISPSPSAVFHTSVSLQNWTLPGVSHIPPSSLNEILTPISAQLCLKKHSLRLGGCSLHSSWTSRVPLPSPASRSCPLSFSHGQALISNSKWKGWVGFFQSLLPDS